MDEIGPRPLNFRPGAISRAERIEIEKHGRSSIGAGDDRSKFARGIRNDRFLMVTGRQVHCPRRRVFSDEARLPLSGGLSFIAQSVHDIRPDLIMLAGAQKAPAYARVLTYCRNYLQAYAKRTNLRVPSAKLDDIAERGLITWLYKKKSPPMDDQALMVRMRRCDYSHILGVVFLMLTARYREAVAHYAWAQTAESGPGRRIGDDPSYWLYALRNAQPPASADRGAQNCGRSFDTMTIAPGMNAVQLPHDLPIAC